MNIKWKHEILKKRFTKFISVEILRKIYYYSMLNTNIKLAEKIGEEIKKLLIFYNIFCVSEDNMPEEKEKMKAYDDNTYNKDLNEVYNSFKEGILRKENNRIKKINTEKEKELNNYINKLNIETKEKIKQIENEYKKKLEKFKK